MMKKYLVPEINFIILYKDADIIICSNMSQKTEEENSFDNIVKDFF